MVESVCPKYGAHVALTGGTLYKDGPRKDCDILFYCIRQLDGIDEDGLLKKLEGIGFEIGKKHGWVRKAKFEGKPIDMFFPDANPPSSTQNTNGNY
jgi:hypothetical protein